MCVLEVCDNEKQHRKWQQEGDQQTHTVSRISIHENDSDTKFLLLVNPSNVSPIEGT
jgi:hypothetical protein